MQAVSGCWEWHALALHLGFPYRQPEDHEDCCEVWVHPAVQEIVGGKHDGETGWSGFPFDVSGLLKEVEAEHLSVRTRMANDPPELVVERQFQGRLVRLPVCLEPPEEGEPTEVLDLTGPGGAAIREKE
jgi:hypothetical protein